MTNKGKEPEELREVGVLQNDYLILIAERGGFVEGETRKRGRGRNRSRGVSLNKSNDGRLFQR